MANIQLLVPLILKWEGGFVNDPADLGGATNKGVTLSTWKSQGYDKNGDGKIDVEDLKLIGREDIVERILRPHYWNRWQADRIESQALANILVDWVWGSGHYGITIPQGILGVKTDGIVGEKTLHVLNSYPDPEGLFEKIKQMRRAYFNMICIDRPTNKLFLKGWLNRLNDFKWIPMILLFFVMISCKTMEKTETMEMGQKVKDEKEMTINAERKANKEQDGHLSMNQNEIRLTETLTAVFDTLDSKPVLKMLQIKRIVSDNAVQTEQQTERRTTGVETVKESQKVKNESQTIIHAKRQEKPAHSSIVWWIAGGIAALLFFAVFLKSLSSGGST